MRFARDRSRRMQTGMHRDAASSASCGDGGARGMSRAESSCDARRSVGVRKHIMSESRVHVVSRISSLAVLTLAGCSPAPNPGDVGILNIELTQGVQLLNRVPLLAGKPTFARVYVQGNAMGGARVPTVGARLTFDGSPPLAPVGTTSVTPPALGSDPRTLGDSFLFALPPALLIAGSHHLHAELVLPAGAPHSAEAELDTDFDVTLGPPSGPVRMRVYGVMYGYTNVPAAYQARIGLTSSTWPARAFSDFEIQRDGAEQMLPVSSLIIDPLPNTAPANFDCRYIGDEATGGCEGYVDGRAWGHRIIDAAFPGGGQTILVMQPESTPGRFLGAHQGSAAGNHVINFQPDSSDIGSTVAHELYHALGLGHTQVGLDSHEAGYPRDDGSMGPYVALRSRPAIQLIPGDDLTGTVTGFDIMSYRFPQWASPYVYCRGMRAASGGAITCPRGLDGWDRTP
jgi:hypothetical protein